MQVRILARPPHPSAHIWAAYCANIGVHFFSVRRQNHGAFMRRSSQVKRTKLNAWLLTWEGTPGSDGPPGGKIIAILDGRRSSSFVEDVVDVIYSRSVYSAYEMAFMANKRNQRDAQYKVLNTRPSQVVFGHMPLIFARRVRDLTITRDEAQDTEHLRWIELPIYGNAKSGSSVVLIQPEEEREYVRSTKTLSRDRASA